MFEIFLNLIMVVLIIIAMFFILNAIFLSKKINSIGLAGMCFMAVTALFMSNNSVELTVTINGDNNNVSNLLYQAAIIITIISCLMIVWPVVRSIWKYITKAFKWLAESNGRR